MTSEFLMPQIHEAAAHLLFANPNDPDDPGLGRYFGFLSQFDRSFDLAKQDSTFDGVGETWRFNHNPDSDGPSINYWEGKIKAVEEDFDAYYEYNIPLVADDETGEKKINFQFRPALPNARHVDSGSRIKSMPEDLPEGLRVQIQSSNVHPNEYLEILRGLFKKLGVHTSYLDTIHPYSRLTGLAIYVRINRGISEDKIVDRNGLLERLAKFSAVRKGQGEWKWDNEEIIGHRTAVALNPTALNKLYAGHGIGKLLKSYHMKSPSEDAGVVTFHPKLEVQWNKEHSPIDSVPWHPTTNELDRDGLLAELEEYLYHALNWADLPVEPNPDVYVSDTYFRLDQCERELDLSMDPTDELVEYEQRVAVTSLVDADLTPKQKATLRTIATDNQPIDVEEVAARSEVSESTVRRTVQKLSDIFTLTRGKVAPEDDVIGRKLQDIFYSIDHVLDRAKHSIQRLSSQRETISKDSVLGKWARRYAVTVEEDQDGLQIAVNLGELTEYQFVQIIRAGYTAANAIGSRTRSRFIDAQFTYTDTDGDHQTVIAGKFGIQHRILGYPLR